MDQILKDGYTKIAGHEPNSDMKDSELARWLMDNWDPRLTGEDLAKECLFRIINHTIFPTPEITREIVEMAESRIGELIDIGEHDPHMAFVEVLERNYYENKNKEKIQESELSGELKAR